MPVSAHGFLDERRINRIKENYAVHKTGCKESVVSQEKQKATHQDRKYTVA